jgi:hypothetical protein
MAQPEFQFERDEQRGRIVVTLPARVTTDVWWTSVSALIDDHVWRDPVVYDMSAAETSPLLLNLPSLVKVVRRLTREHGPRGAVAVVVREGDLLDWRHRLAGLFEGLLDIAVFPSVPDAHAWLDRLDAVAGSPG